MPKRTYYQTFYRRSNVIKETFLSLFTSIAVTARMLLEVFIRKNFGERYFSYPTAIILTIILALIPYGAGNLITSGYGYGYDRPSFWSTVTDNISWYAYLVAFNYFCWVRSQEIKRLPSVFDFARFSLSTGTIHPMFKTLKIGGKPVTIDENGDVNMRKVETFYEPALFFIIGIALILIKQKIGLVILISSILYSLSYIRAYIEGDHFMMDKIDDMICTEELVTTFVEGKTSSKGFNPYGRRPADPEKRKAMYEDMVEDVDYQDIS